MAKLAIKMSIVFKWPGLKPDICLKVFDQEYHAHSVLLKLHSAFFRTFLYSPDKQPSIEASEAKLPPGFRYEWVTEVDEDGTWHLVWASATQKVSNRKRME